MTYLHKPRVAPRPPMGDDFGELIDLMFGGAADASSADPADAVDQFAGGTSTTSADFTTVGNTCKAKNFPALALVKEFQAQLNRVAQVKKFPKIGVDGAIGPGTMTLFASVKAASNGQVMGTPGACMGVAPDVDVIGQQVKQFADTLGAPAMVDPPLLSSLKPPTIVTKSGKVVVAPDAGSIGALATMSGLEKVAILALAGGIGYLLVTGKPKNKPRRS